jgi:hypothetical protein
MILCSSISQRRTFSVTGSPGLVWQSCWRWYHYRERHIPVRYERFGLWTWRGYPWSQQGPSSFSGGASVIAGDWKSCKNCSRWLVRSWNGGGLVVEPPFDAPPPSSFSFGGEASSRDTVLRHQPQSQTQRHWVSIKSNNTKNMSRLNTDWRAGLLTFQLRVHIALRRVRRKRTAPSIAQTQKGFFVTAPTADIDPASAKRAVLSKKPELREELVCEEFIGTIAR